MPPVGFEPTISAVKRPKNYALDRVATGNGRELTDNEKVFVQQVGTKVCKKKKFLLYKQRVTSTCLFLSHNKFWNNNR
jgi:hypothetical protein